MLFNCSGGEKRVFKADGMTKPISFCEHHTDHENSVCLHHCFSSFPLNVTLALLLLSWGYKNWEGWKTWHNSGREGGC